MIAVALWAGSAGAQTYSVETIAFSGTSLSQDELLRFTALQPGEITRDAMQAAADRLTATGLFDSAKYTLDGTALTYALEPSRAVVPVQYDNFPWWDDKALNAAVAAQIPLFHGALYPGGPMREEVTAALVSLLAARGIEGAAISTAPVGDEAGNQVAIRFHINAPRVVLGAVHIDGYSGIWTRPLQALEKSALQQKFDGSVCDKLAEEVRAVYGRQGLLEMRMAAPRLGQPRMVNGEVVVPVTVSILSEGRQYHVSGIRLSGDLFTTQEQLERAANLHAGDVADQDRWTQIRDLAAAPYRSHGYLHAKVDATPTLDREKHTVEYTITVQPGAVYRMGTLTLANLNDEQKAELMPYWWLHPGDVFNPDLIRKSIDAYHAGRAENLQSIRNGYTVSWRGNETTHIVDVVVTFDQ